MRKIIASIIIFTTLLFTLGYPAISFGAEKTTKKHYGYALCDAPGFTCRKLKNRDTWKKLFPNEKYRDMVMRLNRTNLPLFTRKWIVIPDNIETLDYNDLSPLALKYDTTGEPTILVSLSLLAFAAYNKEGELILWGPISAGKDYCADTKASCKTATGTFRVKRKSDEECISGQFPVVSKSKRGGAPMPYCTFFFRGIAFHASTLPGYNGSHGCVRLFLEDAQWLNENFFKIGTKVVVVD